MFIFVFLKVDLDLGNYERFLDTTLTRDNNITTGKIYQVTCLSFLNFRDVLDKWLLSRILSIIDFLTVLNFLSFFHQSVINKERKGDYLGKTVQVMIYLGSFI